MSKLFSKEQEIVSCFIASSPRGDKGSIAGPGVGVISDLSSDEAKAILEMHRVATPPATSENIKVVLPYIREFLQRRRIAEFHRVNRLPVI